MKLSFVCQILCVYKGRKKGKVRERERQAGRLVGGEKVLRGGKQEADLGGKGKVQRLINILGQVPGDFNDSLDFFQALDMC